MNFDQVNNELKDIDASSRQINSSSGFDKNLAFLAGKNSADSYMGRLDFDDDDDDDLDFYADMGHEYLRGVASAMMDYYPIDVYDTEVWKELRDAVTSGCGTKSKKDKKKKNSIKSNYDEYDNDTTEYYTDFGFDNDDNICYLYPEEPVLDPDDPDLVNNNITKIGTYDFDSDGICQVLKGTFGDMVDFAEDQGYILHPDFTYFDGDLDIEDRREITNSRKVIKSESSWNKRVQEIMDEEGVTREEAEEMLNDACAFSSRKVIKSTVDKTFFSKSINDCINEGITKVDFTVHGNERTIDINEIDKDALYEDIENGQIYQLKDFQMSEPLYQVIEYMEDMPVEFEDIEMVNVL